MNFWHLPPFWFSSISVNVLKLRSLRIHHPRLCRYLVSSSRVQRASAHRRDDEPVLHRGERTDQTVPDAARSRRHPYQRSFARKVEAGTRLRASASGCSHASSCVSCMRHNHTVRSRKHAAAAPLSHACPWRAPEHQDVILHPFHPCREKCRLRLTFEFVG